MRTALRLLLLLACCAAVPHPGLAAAWPDNWLGAPDTSFVHLRIGVFYYGAVLDDMPDEKGVPHLPLGGKAPDGTPLPGTKEVWLERLGAMPETSEDAQQGNLNQVMGELEAARQFYWRNSRFNCAITYDLLTADEAGTPVLWSSIANTDAPYYGPLGHPKYAGVAESGNYDGLVQVYVLYRYNAASGQLERVRGGGGFTIGCALKDETTGQKRCGWSWWAAPPPDHACGSDWLFVHEFGHQLDSLFEQSGHPEHWFNHLARNEANTGPFGEHFDCMAYILRRTPEPDWQDLQWGEQLVFTDVDEDAVPDFAYQRTDTISRNASSTPELSADVLNLLETDNGPPLADCDHDGLTDYTEFMVINGNDHGHGERWHPMVPRVNPFIPDSDNDGILDGADPIPWLALPGYVLSHNLVGPSCSVALPGDGDAPPLAMWLSYDPDQFLTLMLAWGDAGSADSEALLRPDLDGDGWFNGNDNWRIELDGGGITRFPQNKAASDTDWPQDVAADNALAGWTAIDVPAGYAHACALRFKKGEVTGLQARSGERIGVNIGVRPKGWQWFYMLGEPNGFIPLTLR